MGPAIRQLRHQRVLLVVPSVVSSQYFGLHTFSVSCEKLTMVARENGLYGHQPCTLRLLVRLSDVFPKEDPSPSLRGSVVDAVVVVVLGIGDGGQRRSCRCYESTACALERTTGNDNPPPDAAKLVMRSTKYI
ncbi:hypothetical protein EDD18DRAFT_1335937 [Armillaria luteobubalina]|uniref:Uncharacterized protein n=1 Tax=Armillaria luteobubalina TaxID=153913 RepID=A0AA39PKV2_9AGAR|nr:hypothetical protein EDD18DRAFT_1335937 [Armillaria luteobubalina]